MCRIRSIRETAKIFKEMDPETEITETTLRKMIATGVIPAFKTGNKFLINVDLLMEMFEGAPDGSIKLLSNTNRFVIEK